MKELTVLIPTCNRNDALLITLTSLVSQTYSSFDIVMSDQSDKYLITQNEAALISVIRVLQHHGKGIRAYQHLPRKGMAEHRQFLLDQVETPYCLYIDDDLLLEPYAIDVMMRTIKKERCGFVGSAVIGLSYKNDHRPHQQHVELWEGKVQPEHVKPGSEAWNRYKLHNAANILHVQERLGAAPDSPIPYKVAWVGGCTLYDTARLRDVGGFSFWKNLPKDHCGEDVQAQLLVMKKYGGCGVMPSGAYHQEHPTTLPNREYNAPQLL